MNNTSVKQQNAGYEDSADWLTILSLIERPLARRVGDISGMYQVSPIDLKLRVLLHLPRYRAEELADLSLVYTEIERLAAMTMEHQREFREWANQEPIRLLERARAYVVEASADVASVIHERFHYIGTVREGRHFALYFAGQRIPAALATVSEIDVEKLKSYAPERLGRGSLLLSRMFSFRWAPLNSISYLLGKIGHWLGREGQVKSLMTWVNPNLGFRASSYRAANWVYVGAEPVIYRYVDGNYLTGRQFFENAQKLSVRVQTSHLHLAPLQVWCHSLTHE